MTKNYLHFSTLLTFICQYKIFQLKMYMHILKPKHRILFGKCRNEVPSPSHSTDYLFRPTGLRTQVHHLPPSYKTSYPATYGKPAPFHQLLLSPPNNSRPAGSSSVPQLSSMAKCSKIRNIVWLRQTLRRWRSRAAARTAAGGGGGAVSVPAGHVAVCVGGSSRRFVVRAAHLNHPVFRELLRQSEEEYGFPSTPGPVALPCCDEDRFLDVLRRVSSEDRLLRRGRSFCCRVPVVTSRDVAARPLLQGMAVEKLVW